MKRQGCAGGLIICTLSLTHVGHRGTYAYVYRPSSCRLPVAKVSAEPLSLFPSSDPAAVNNILRYHATRIAHRSPAGNTCKRILVVFRSSVAKSLRPSIAALLTYCDTGGSTTTSPPLVYFKQTTEFAQPCLPVSSMPANLALDAMRRGPARRSGPQREIIVPVDSPHTDSTLRKCSLWSSRSSAAVNHHQSPIRASCECVRGGRHFEYMHAEGASGAT